MAPPEDFGTLVARLDPRANLTLAGSNVTAWVSEDASSHVATIVGTPRVENDWNGNPSIAFDGSSAGIYFPTIGAPFAGSDVPFYVIAAVRVFDPVLNDYIWCFTQSAASVANSGLTISTNERWCMTRNDGATNKFPTASNFSASHRDPRIMSMMFNGTQGSLYEDGDLIIDAADLDVNSIALDSFNLGFRRSATPTAFCACKIGMVLVYSSLDDSGRIAAEQWIRDEGYGTDQEAVTRTYFATSEFENFEVPVTTAVTVECFGGGGGSRSGGGGGGGGAYARGIALLPPVDPRPIVVAAPAGANTDGADTAFDVNLVVAVGGKSFSNGGTGGTAAASTGTTKFSGGNATLGTGNQTGGGGAGDIGNGSGPNGGNYLGGFGMAWEPGGGGRSTDGFEQSGARGEMRITWNQFPSSSAHPYVIERTHVRTGNSSGIGVNMPSAIREGDLLLIVAGADTNVNLTVSGWNKLGQENDLTGTTCTMAVFWKFAEGGDTATLGASALSRLAAACYQVRNGGVPTWETATANSTDADAPEITFDDGDYLVIAACVWDGSGPIGLSGAPANYDNVRPIYPVSSTGVALVTCDRKVSGTSEDPGAFTSLIEQWVAATIAIPFATPTAEIEGSSAGTGVAEATLEGLGELAGSILVAATAEGTLVNAAPPDSLVGDKSCDAAFGSKRFAIFVRWNGASLAMGSGTFATPALQLRHNQFVYRGTTLNFTPRAPQDHLLVFCFDGADMFVRIDGTEVARTAATLGALASSPFVIGEAGSDAMDGSIRQIVACADDTLFLTDKQMADIEAFMMK